MKEICLFRHAKSSWKYPRLDDFERPLNKRGRKNAPFMGQILHAIGFYPDLIISSPAARAAMTARIVAMRLGYSLEHIEYLASIYESSHDNLLHVLSNLEDRLNRIMLVGHNPAMTILANKLGDTSIANLPTSGAYCVAFNISKWSQIRKKTGALQFFEFPKKSVS
jgi:phosphohistidine phosphatase